MRQEHGAWAYKSGRCKCEEICRPAARAYNRAHRSPRKRKPGVLPRAERLALVKAQGEERRQYVIGEVEWLLDTDVAESIAHRLGYANLSSLQKVLYAWDRGDLAIALSPSPIDGRPQDDWFA